MYLIQRDLTRCYMFSLFVVFARYNRQSLFKFTRLTVDTDTKRACLRRVICVRSVRNSTGCRR